MPKTPECRTKILPATRGGFRVRVTDLVTKQSFDRYYGTYKDAHQAAGKLQRGYKRSIGIPLSEAFKSYSNAMQLKGNKPSSIAVTMDRITAVLASVPGVTLTGDIDSSMLLSAWRYYLENRNPSINTQVGALTETRCFLNWCHKNNLVKDPDLMVGIEVVGKRNKGKEQFIGIDESRKFVMKAIELGDAGAIAAATALLMGMRASEITDRKVCELDDGGKVLVITASKTAAGVRRVRVPEVLQPILVAMCIGKESSDKIFGNDADRHWLRYAVSRVCKAAGVRSITTHGLRGTHASLAVEAGVAGVAVAASMGHESFRVTKECYASAESVSRAAVNLVELALN
jgi:site-specific recombinase XerD